MPSSNNRSHRESLINMNRHVARKAGLSANTHILNAGYGVGGLSTWLAKEYDATVSGITICQSQLVQGGSSRFRMMFRNEQIST
ncbi:hypothetical protein HGQ66_25410 [Serratia marcescens]|nr:hypothetical protein [Serratia marcescens]